MSNEASLDHLLSLWQRAKDEGREKSPAELCQDRPELLPHLERLVAGLQRMAALGAAVNSTLNGPPADANQVSAASLPTIPGYEILEKIGQGGMGVVFRARQGGLARLCALKMIVTGTNADADERTRFLAEAEAIARVKHPSIVQIYDFGTHDGLPYFSMELCEGGSLARKLHDAVLAPDEAAALVEKIAQGVHAAHCAGILHRDLKPLNVLLADDGSPRVSDFGLAKQLHSEGQTPTGHILGTASYMAPEQAQGKKDIGPLADVYSVGAILYECLTGRPPFKAANVYDTLFQVVSQDPVAPRDLNAKIPRDLDTICLTCLKKEPGKRYASAADLAQDLRRYLEDRPIAARPAGWAERSMRWCRRNRGVAALAASLLVVILASLAGLTALYLQAAGNERKALANLELANANLRKAARAVDDCYTTATQHPVLQGTALQPIRNVFLQSALQYYQEFVAQAPEDPALQSELARNYFRVGTIISDLGTREKALEALRQARTIQERLAQQEPDNVQARTDLARTCARIGSIASRVGKHEEARQTLERSALLWVEVLRDRPDPGAEAELASVHGNLAAFWRHRDANASAEQYRKALDLQTKLVRANPAGTEPRLNLATTHDSLGWFHHRISGNAKESLRNYQLALGHLEKLVEEHPAVPDYQHSLCVTLNNLGIMQQRVLAQPELALQAFQRALNVREKLAQNYPHVREYQHGLALSQGSLGVCYKGLGKRKEALAAFTRTAEAFAKLSKAEPSNGEYLEQLAMTYSNCGSLAEQMEQYAEAIGQYRKALAIFEKQHARDRADTYLRNLLGLTQGGLGMCLLETGQLQEAEQALLQSVGHLGALVELSPRVPQYREPLAEYCLALTQAHLLLRKPDEAQATLRKWRDLAPKGAAVLYNSARQFALCGEAIGHGKKDLEPAEQVERRKWLDLAMDTLRQAVAAGYNDVANLKQDRALQLLRSRSDFAEILAGVAKKKE